MPVYFLRIVLAAGAGLLFPVALRRRTAVTDWLVGGVFGLMRGAVVCMVLYVVANYLMTMFIPQESAIYGLIQGSKLLNFVSSITFLDVKGILNAIIGA